MKIFAADSEVLFLISASYLPDRIWTTEHLLHVYHNKTIHFEGFYHSFGQIAKDKFSLLSLIYFSKNTISWCKNCIFNRNTFPFSQNKYHIIMKKYVCNRMVYLFQMHDVLKSF